MSFGIGLGKHWYVGSDGNTTCDFGSHNQWMRESYFALCCGICLLSVVGILLKLLLVRLLLC